MPCSRRHFVRSRKSIEFRLDGFHLSRAVHLVRGRVRVRVRVRLGLG